jgi:CheY-like chemotaxis protein
MALQAPPKCRILIVEDDQDSCEALARMLRRMGHEIECASSVGEALVKLDEWFPQCVLLDLMLPDASGALVLRKIRVERLPIKVAVITAAGKNSPTLRQALGYDPDIVFEKPLHHHDLIRWLDHVTPNPP